MGGSRYVATAEVSFHLGELYLLIPFLHGIDYAPDEKVCLLFTSRDLYREYLSDPMLVEAVRELGADVRTAFIRKPRAAASHSRVRALLREAVRAVQRPLHRRRVLPLIAASDVFMAQIVGGMVEKIIRPGDPFPSRVVRFPHTSAAQIMDVTEAKKQTFRQMSPGDTMLLLDPDAEPYYTLWGMKSSIVLGYHSLGERWFGLLERLAPPRRGHVVIYSFASRPDQLPREKWEVLHHSAYRAIRDEFGDIEIVIKPHPYQDLADLQRFVEADGWQNASVVTDHPMLISWGARFAVGFLTGGIYNSMMLDIPSINYFNARDDYIAAHGSFMQDLAAVGAADARTDEEFRAQLGKVKAGTLITDFGTRKRAIPVIRSWHEFQDRLDEIRRG
jgi:hypothetical protein